MKDLIIISAGRLGREVHGWATEAIASGAPWRLKGFLDSRSTLLDGFAYGTPILGDVDDYVIQNDDVFIGAIGDPRDKAAYYTPIVKKGGQFINLIHPRANIGPNVRLGTGVVMAPFACATSDITIGSFVTMLPFSMVTHDDEIGDWCQICSHCALNGKVILEEGVFLGSHACIVPERRIGSWAFVGAGSVVTNDVVPGAKVVGNPARPVALRALRTEN